MSKVIFSSEELQSSLEVWQQRLRLQDWIIKARVARGKEFSDDNRQGEVSWILTKKMATILILDPIDYPPDAMLSQDMENCLVHELLHLHFAPISESESGGLLNVAVEQAIESITSGIMSSIRRR